MRACPECLSVFATDPEFCSFDGTALLSGDNALSGKVLAGHRIDSMIGLSGTGCVFRGTRESDGAQCAIKVLFGEMATDKSISARFEREAEAMSAIKHRNVVSIWDYGTTERGLIYLVMGLLNGVTLKDRIETDAPFEPDRAVRILEQLTAGLAEAHRQGFVHRDLKPGNVIVEGPVGKEEVKILDFGIVASLRENSERERLTKTGYIIGTPTYMAPEQVDPSAVTPQVDVYALGVILYEMLTGAPAVYRHARTDPGREDHADAPADRRRWRHRRARPLDASHGPGATTTERPPRERRAQPPEHVDRRPRDRPRRPSRPRVLVHSCEERHGRCADRRPDG